MTWPVNYPVPVDYALLSIRNVGAQTLYLGGTNVTPTSGLAISPGSVVQIPTYPQALTGASISIATDGQLTLPKPKPTVRELITDAKAAALKLGKSHAREMALNALAQAGLWIEEAGK